MNNKFFKVALIIVLAVTSINANAQQAYDSGLYMTSTKFNNQPLNMWNYFTPDSLMVRYFSGRGEYKVISNANSNYVAILTSAPSASLKKAVVLNPEELREMFAAMPKLVFNATNETKMISNFNCRKIIATDVRSKKTYEVWTTKDVVLPNSAIPIYYQGIEGFPIQYISFREGIQELVTVLTVRNVTLHPGSYAVPPDFFRISYKDYKALIGLL
jgi:hypothetical protein